MKVPISELFPIRETAFEFNDYIGLEIEVEGVKRLSNLDLDVVRLAAHFSERGYRHFDKFLITKDGSLRSRVGANLEYIFQDVAQSIPLRMQELLVAVDEWKRLLPLVRYSFSDRTGIHVHLDFSQQTLQEAYQFILLYALFEPMFFSFCGKHRKTPSYHRPIADNFDFSALLGIWRDALSLGGQSHSDIRSSKIFNQLHEKLKSRRYKYNALNPHSLIRLNTIEVRILESTDDTAKIKGWIKSLQALKELSMTDIDFDGLLYQVSDEEPENFLANFLSEDVFRLFLHPEIKIDLVQGARALQEFLYL